MDNLNQFLNKNYFINSKKDIVKENIKLSSELNYNK